MFGKSKDKNRKSKDQNDRVPHPVQQFQRLAAISAEPESTDQNDRLPQAEQFQRLAAMPKGSALAEQISSISRDLTIVGKICGEGTIQVFGRIEGEIRALAVLIGEGAQVDGDVVAEQLTIGGQIKGTIRANRVKLNSTAVVEGDIFHRSLSIEENARFEGSSKRQENAVDASHTALARSANQDRVGTNVTALDGNRKSNGAPDHDGGPIVARQDT